MRLEVVVVLCDGINGGSGRSFFLFGWFCFVLFLFRFVLSMLKQNCSIVHYVCMYTTYLPFYVSVDIFFAYFPMSERSDCT